MFIGSALNGRSDDFQFSYMFYSFLGGIVARYNCKKLGSAETFVTEVILSPGRTFNCYIGSLLILGNGKVTITDASRKDFGVIQHELGVSTEKLTLLVGGVHVGNACFFSGRLVVIIADMSEVEFVTTTLKTLTEVKDNPVKWQEISGVKRIRVMANANVTVRSQPVQVSMDLFEHLEGSQLNNLLQSNKLEICGSRNSEFDEKLHVQRWLVSDKYTTLDLQENTTYVVLNAEERDVLDISKGTQGHAFFIENIEDLYYLPVQQVVVTGEIDCNATIRHLRSMCEPAQNMTVRNIKLFKFNKLGFCEIIAEEELLQQDYKVKVTRGPPSDGKTWLLQRVYNTCSNPVCLFTANQLIHTFSESNSDGITPEDVRYLIIDNLSTTQFDRVVLEHAFKHLTILVLIDDVSVECESELYKIVKVILQLSNLSVIITSQASSQTVAKNIDDACLFVDLLPMSRNDKTDVISKRSMPVFSTMIAQTIFNHYELKFCKMPILIWTAVADVYKKRIGEQNYRITPQNMMLDVTLPEIYDKFVDMSFQSFCKKNPAAADNRMEYEFAHMRYAVQHVAPELFSIVPLLQSLNQISYKDNLESSNCPHFQEYFVDLLSLNVLTGGIQANTDFSDFFYQAIHPFCEK